jgi:hypothetical protein
MASRRQVLTLIGGGIVAAATSTACVTAGPSRKARGPWRQAGRYPDVRRRALSYALLAPNPHNRQPWRVHLDGDDALTLYCDLDRRLPVTDPFDRQITIGCGAFLELLAIAAAQEGVQATVDPFPEGGDMRTLDARPVARVTFAAGRGTPDPLFAEIPKRRTNRLPYDPREVPADALARLAEAGRVYGVLATTSGEAAMVEMLRALTWRAHEREVTTKAAMQESIDLMRIGAREVDANPDGIVLEGMMVEVGRRFGILSRQKLGDPTSTAFRQGLDQYREKARSAHAFGWLVNDNTSRTDQLAAGRAYARFQLTATSLGLVMHPWSQALQEYREMADLYAVAQQKLGGGRCVQMLVRIGYAADVPPAPRRGLEALLV